jgi:hypothetical protein
VPALKTLADTQSTDHAPQTYGDLVHFVHVYIVEPHPIGSPSPYSGQLWETAYDNDQPMTMAARVTNAQDLVAAEPVNLAGHLLLIDELSPGQNNPMWCSYGNCPNCAFLIGQDGRIDTTQLWFGADGMLSAFDDLLE